jgi:hypothetical protein
MIAYLLIDISVNGNITGKENDCDEVEGLDSQAELLLSG